MKRIFLTLVSLVAIVAGAHAQLGFGIKAGATFNSLSWDGCNDELPISDKPGVGYAIGAMFEYIYKPNGLGLDITAIYSKEGLKANYHLKNGSPTILDFTTAYMKFPFHLKWMPSLINGGKVVKPIVYTGPEVGLILDSNKNDNHMGRWFEESASFKWNIGIGAELWNTLQVCAQYGIGLNRMFEYNDASIYRVKGINAKSSTLTVTLTWMFR